MEKQDMVNVLHALFSKAMEINLNDETFNIIKIDSDENVRCNNFTQWISIFIDEGWVHNDDVKDFNEFFTIKNLKQAINLGPLYMNYRRKISNDNYMNVVAYVIKSCKSTEENPIILLGIMPIDWITTEY